MFEMGERRAWERMRDQCPRPRVRGHEGDSGSGSQGGADFQRGGSSRDRGRLWPFERALFTLSSP